MRIWPFATSFWLIRGTMVSLEMGTIFFVIFMPPFGSSRITMADRTGAGSYLLRKISNFWWPKIGFPDA
jgi:hypothetical protein